MGFLLTLLVAGQTPAWGEEESVALAPWRLAIDGSSAGRLKGKGSESTLSVQLDRVAGRDPSKVAAMSAPINLDSKFEYSLSFQAKSATPRQVDLLVADKESAGTTLAVKETYSLTTSWSSCLYFFRPNKNDPAGEIRIELGASDADVDLKEIKLTRRPVVASALNATSKRAPDRWTLAMPADSKGEVIEDSSKNVSVHIDKNTSKEPWEINIHRAVISSKRGGNTLFVFGLGRRRLGRSSSWRCAIERLGPMCFRGRRFRSRPNGKSSNFPWNRRKGSLAAWWSLFWGPVMPMCR